MFFLLLPIILTTLVSAAVFTFIINFTSPRDSDGSLTAINLVYFFVSGSLSLAGFITLVLYWVGNWRLKRNRTGVIESVHKPKLILKRSLRHGLLFSGTILAIGLMNVFGFSNPLNIILLISAAILIEVYFFGH